MSTAEDFKNLGNAALQSGKVDEAIDHYTKAINLDGANHVYFSNRSAAYLKKGDAHNALEDANACIGLSGDHFSKGYSRKGAALHSLKRYNDSIAAYEEGLKKFPGDAALQKGLEDVKREKDGPVGPSGGVPNGGLFSPQMMAQMALDPRMRPFLNDPELMTKIQLIQKNPALLQTMLQTDPKIMEMLSVMMGADAMDEDEGKASPSSSTKPKSAHAPPPSKKEEAKKKDEPMEVEEDWSTFSPEERAKKEKQKAANEKKTTGNDLYKAKKFDEALAAYDEAIAIDPTNMTYYNNKAAVYFTQAKYNECIEACQKAVDVGKENRAPFEDRAKALTRMAKAYQKLGNLEKAIESCQEAQLEFYDKDTQRMLKTLELEKKKADALQYQDDAKAEEAKTKGNEHFRNQEWPQAVDAYEEAVKRAPRNAPIRNNLAAALCKIMDFSGAQRQIEVALEIDPKYVKAWARKGDIEMYMREYHKAMESYKKGLELDPENTACKDGLRKCMSQVTAGRANMTEEEKKQQAAHAMADPEIQVILRDPVMQQVLRDFGEHPAEAQKAVQDPIIRAKIEKLIAAGIIETR